jgi:hypothetical protein
MDHFHAWKGIPIAPVSGASGYLRSCLLTGAAALAAAMPALATPSLPFPTYPVGPQADGSIVMSTNQTITPTGTLVQLGTYTRSAEQRGG